MRVLVTRPREDAGRIAEILRARGHKPVIAPLLETRFRDGPEIALDGVQAVLATSANGVRALVRRTPRRDVPVFAVGPQTAEEARDAGFADVRNADGDAKALAEAARRWARPGGGALLHVKGAEGDGSLAASLDGFDARRLVLYDVTETGAAIDLDSIDAVLLFSPRSARIFAARAPESADVIAICISAATARALGARAFKAVRIAAKPNQDALLACLDRA